MANLHILKRTDNDVGAVAHVAVAATNNTAGVPWRDAVVRSGAGGTTILPDGDGTGGTISAAEKVQIESGAIIEVVTTLRPDSVSGGAAPLNAYLDAEYTRVAAEVTARLARELKYYGATR